MPFILLLLLFKFQPIIYLFKAKQRIGLLSNLLYNLTELLAAYMKNAKQPKHCIRLLTIVMLICLLQPINSYAYLSSVLTYTDTNWNNLPIVLSQIQAPAFPNRDINIVNVGAKTDGTSLSTTYIQKAIDSCSGLGGGRVVVPKGTFVTGALRLKNNVNLYIANGATLKFSTNTADYLPVVLTRYQGIECYNYSPFIYAYGVTNIAITGSGTLDGQASNSNWWAWKTTGASDETLLDTMGNDNVPVAQRIFGSGHFLRPVFIQPYNSTNILIDSVTIINSPMWEINPVLSQNVTVRNVVINSSGPNNDGCDPECCNYVLIDSCSFSTGDDCIAVKSGKNNDGRRVNVPSQNIVIQNCNMQNGHGGITMGSECTGGIRNVYAQNCTLNSTNLETALRVKTNSVRGGTIENIFMRNCTIGQVSSEILQVDMYYDEGDVGSFTPIVRNFEIDSVTSNSSPSVFTVNCYQRSPITDVRIIGTNFNNATSIGTLSNVCRLQMNNSFVNSSVPLIPTATSGYTEAEAYSAKSEWGWSNVLTGFKGNGYMEFANPDNSIDWTISKTQNEADTLNIRYANVDSVNNKPCTVLVNNVNAGQFTFAPTKSAWSNEKKVIAFQKGTNTIRLVSDNNNPGAYIDRFSMALSALLPVKFISVDASVTAKITLVKWNVATEENITEYIIQRSTNGIDFINVGEVKAQGLNQYQWNDNDNTDAVVYYRIQAIETTGSNEYSSIVTVKRNNDTSEMLITPNPINNKTVNVQLRQLSKGAYTLQVISISGQIIVSRQIDITSNYTTQSISLPAAITQGDYIVLLRGKNTSVSKKIMVY